MMVVNAEDIQLLNMLQKDFPLQERPFAPVAKRLGCTESVIVERLESLRQAGVVGRLGAVFNHATAGASTLVAMAVPEHEVDDMALRVNALPQVNHNYLREDRFNLWFVVTAPNREAVAAVLDTLRLQFPGTPLLDLPMEKGYHIDLGFPLC